MFDRYRTFRDAKARGTDVGQTRRLQPFTRAASNNNVKATHFNHGQRHRYLILCLIDTERQRRQGTSHRCWTNTETSTTGAEATLRPKMRRRAAHFCTRQTGLSGCGWTTRRRRAACTTGGRCPANHQPSRAARTSARPRTICNRK